MDKMLVLICKCSKLWIILLSNVFTPTKTIAEKTQKQYK